MIGGCVTANVSPSNVPVTAYAPHVTSPDDSLPSTPSHDHPSSGKPEHCGGHDSATGPTHSSASPPLSSTVPVATTSPFGGSGHALSRLAPGGGASADGVAHADSARAPAAMIETAA